MTLRKIIANDVYFHVPILKNLCIDPSSEAQKESEMANTKSNANPVIVGYIDGMGNEYCLDHHEEHTTLSFRLGGKIKVVWGKQRDLDACATGCVTCLEANALIGAWLVG